MKQVEYVERILLFLLLIEGGCGSGGGQRLPEHAKIIALVV